MDEKAALHAESTKALIAFARRCTIPVIAKVTGDDGRKAVHGSGTLYKIKERHFLVTATHVADLRRQGLIELGLPTRNAANHVVKQIFLPEHAGDVTVYELPSSYVEAIERDGRWTFVDGDADLGREHDVYGRHFLILGYPSAVNTVEQSKMTQVSIPIFTTLYKGSTDGVTDASTPKEWNHLFAWPADLNCELYGISGCAVWALRLPAGPIWTPSASMRPVAVETAIMSGRWLRTTAWEAIELMIKNTQPAFGDQPMTDDELLKDAVAFEFPDGYRAAKADNGKWQVSRRAPDGKYYFTGNYIDNPEGCEFDDREAALRFLQAKRAK